MRKNQANQQLVTYLSDLRNFLWLFTSATVIFCLLCVSITREVYTAPKVEEEVVGPAVPGVTYVISSKNVRVGYISQKGSRMTVTVDGAEGPTFDQILNPDGIAVTLNNSRTTVLSGEGSPIVFSEDGKHYAYAARQGDEYVVILDGKEVTRGPIGVKVFGYGPLRFIGNGRHLWFKAKADTDYYRMFIDGKPLPASHRNPAIVFSRDGSRYIASGTYPQKPSEEWFLLDGKSSSYPGDNPQFTGDNKLVAVDRSHPGSATLLVDGKPLFKGDAINQIWISPAGNRIAAIVNTAGKWALTIDGKVVPNTEGVQVLRVFFSPDGSRWAAHCTGIAQTHFMILDGRKGNAYQYIESHVNPPAFTPDSSKFLYAAMNAGRQFVVVNEEESEGFAVFLSLRSPRYAFARDGGRYGYMTSENTTPRMFHFVVDGKRQTLPDMFGVSDTFFFSDNGATYAFVAGPAARNEITTLVVNGKPVPEVKLSGGFSGSFRALQLKTHHYTLSPDGKYIAHRGFRIDDPKKTGLFINGRFISEKVYSAPLFTPDSQHVFWLENERHPSGTGTVYVLHVNGQSTGIRINAGDVLKDTNGTWEIGTDGTLTLLTFDGGSMKRYRVSPSSSTNIRKLLEQDSVQAETATMKPEIATTQGALAANDGNNSVAVFNGEWSNSQHRYGFRLQEGIGIATQSNNRHYAAGDVILRIESVSGQSFRGSHLYRDGRWRQVTGKLNGTQILQMKGPTGAWDMTKVTE